LRRYQRREVRNNYTFLQDGILTPGRSHARSECRYSGPALIVASRWALDPTGGGVPPLSCNLMRRGWATAARRSLGEIVRVPGPSAYPARLGRSGAPQVAVSLGHSCVVLLPARGAMANSRLREQLRLNRSESPDDHSTHSSPAITHFNIRQPSMINHFSALNLDCCICI
jgi:hypothetical protein